MAAKTNDIYGRILRRLASGELAVGDRVSELSLASELKVSRTPVREAIKRLQGEGYFDQVHRYGTVVRQPSMQELADAYDLREALETHIVEHTPPDRLATAFDEMQTTCDDLEELACQFGRPVPMDGHPELLRTFFGLDGRFHDAMIRSSGNGRFETILGHARLFGRINAVRRHSVITFEVVMGVQREHTDILRLLRAGETAAASESLRRHIRGSKAGALDWLRLQTRMTRPA